MDDLLTPREVAAILKIERKALMSMRKRKLGPPAIRVGKRLRFPRASLETWLRERPART